MSCNAVIATVNTASPEHRLANRFTKHKGSFLPFFIYSCLVLRSSLHNDSTHEIGVEVRILFWV